jgi:hypothetical protein
LKIGKWCSKRMDRALYLYFFSARRLPTRTYLFAISENCVYVEPCFLDRILIWVAKFGTPDITMLNLGTRFILILNHGTADAIQVDPQPWDSVRCDSSHHKFKCLSNIHELTDKIISNCRLAYISMETSNQCTSPQIYTALSTRLIR